MPTLNGKKSNGKVKLTKKNLCWESKKRKNAGTYFLLKIYGISETTSKFEFVTKFQHSIYKTKNFEKKIIIKKNDTCKTIEIAIQKAISLSVSFLNRKYPSLIQQTEYTKNFTDEQLAQVLLYNFKKNHLVYKLSESLRSRKYGDKINYEFVKGEANKAISYTIQACNQLNGKSNDQIIDIQSSTNLSQISKIKGYCTRVLQNSIKKEITYWQRQKRSFYNSEESLDEKISHESESVKLDYYTTSNVNKDYEEDKELLVSLKEMWKTLIKEDNLINSIPNNKKSFLSLTFKEFLRPENNGVIRTVANNLDTTEHMIKKNLAEMTTLLTQRFNADAQDLIKVLKERSTRISSASTKDKSLLLGSHDYDFEKYKINQYYEYKFQKNNKVKVICKTQIVSHENKIDVQRKVYEQSKTVSNTDKLIQKAKMDLKNLSTVDQSRAEKFLPQIIKKDNQELLLEKNKKNARAKELNIKRAKNKVLAA